MAKKLLTNKYSASKKKSQQSCAQKIICLVCFAMNLDAHLL